MSNLSIRNSIRGLAFRNGKVLVIEVKDGKDVYYILPGGKQEFGETSTETLEREFQEEIGCGVIVKECVLIRELIGQRRQSVVGSVGNLHAKELYFVVDLRSEPDLFVREHEQKSIAWKNVDQLEMLGLKPVYVATHMRSLLERASSGLGAIYAGDVD